MANGFTINDSGIKGVASNYQELNNELKKNVTNDLAELVSILTHLWCSPRAVEFAKSIKVCFDSMNEAFSSTVTDVKNLIDAKIAQYNWAEGSSVANIDVIFSNIDFSALLSTKSVLDTGEIGVSKETTVDLVMENLKNLGINISHEFSNMLTNWKNYITNSNMFDETTLNSISNFVGKATDTINEELVKFNESCDDALADEKQVRATILSSE